MILLHVTRKQDPDDSSNKSLVEKRMSAANILHGLHELVPVGARDRCRPEVLLKFGDPADQILETARENTFSGAPPTTS